MFAKNHILRLKKHLSREDCQRIIKFFDINPHLHEKDHRVGAENKTDTEIICNFTTSKGPTWLLDKIGSGIAEYCKEYPFVDELYPFQVAPTFKIQKYSPGEFYKQIHCENPGIQKEEISISLRMMAWMFYLNDVTDAGQTYFPSQNKKYQPRAGDLMLWPAYFTHPHCGIPSKTQTKYIVTGWVSFKTDY